MHHLDASAIAARRTAQQRTLRLAWVTLLVFFTFFLLLIGWAAYVGRQFYLTATNPRDATLIARGPAEWISWQPSNRTIFQGVSTDQLINEGDRVRIVRSAGYGQVASIRLFDETQLDLWAGADVRLDRLRTTRWSDQSQDVVIRQTSGYVRYDTKLNQPYNRVRFWVQVGNAQIELLPGGSYSIDVSQVERQMVTPAQVSFQPFTVDVAVRSGTAVVHGSYGAAAVIGADQRVEIDPAGVVGLAVPARWELIRDGGFSQFTQEEYNNTTLEDQPGVTRSDTWQIYGTPPLPLSQRGFFQLSQICRPPQTTLNCTDADRRVAGWFYRAGNQTNGFTTGIQQDLGPMGMGVDISEYRSLVFSLWARILEQSLDDVGDRGTECPVMIRLIARRTSPADPEQARVVCVYSDADTVEPDVKDEAVTYIEVQKAEWAYIQFDLRDESWLPDYRYLQSIQIYANGHDYDTRVAEVSLVGEQ